MTRFGVYEYLRFTQPPPPHNLKFDVLSKFSVVLGHSGILYVNLRSFVNLLSVNRPVEDVVIPIDR